MGMKTTLYRQGQGDRQPYTLHLLKSLDDFMEHVDFIREGYESLEELVRVSWEIFASQVLQVLKRDDGMFGVFLSKNGKPLGYVMVVDDTADQRERVALIYAAYSNGKYLGAADEAVRYAEEWATAKGFNILRASSRRMNGAAMKLFKKKLQFRPAFIVFEKGL